MAKSAKQLNEAGAGKGSKAEPSNDGQTDGSPGLASATGSPAPAKAPTKTTRKRAPRVTTDKTAAAKPRKVASRKQASPAEVAISDDDIRLRAYFIAEKRSQDGVGGDSSSDWLEARRQLHAEAGGQA